ncbi:MAG: hypothetical protein VCG02_09950, partial [Verrucomicrobiota bacterium]
STYNVIVYHAHNSANAKANTRVGSTTYYSENQASYGGSFIQGTNTTTGTYPVANVVRFENVSPDGSGTVEVEVKKFIESPQLTDGVGVAGLQLELLTGAWPEVNPPNILQDPADVLAVVGDTVSLSILADGPWDVEWFTNGVSAALGTSTDYNLTTTAAHKDALVHAVVSNPAGTATSQTATLTLDDPAPAQLVQGFLHVEHYGNIGGVIVSNLYNHVPFQNRAFDYDWYVGSAAVPDADLNNFGRIVEGFVRTPVDLTLNFFTRSDDQSEFYFNPVPGTGAASIPSDFPNITADATELDCCDAFQEPGVDTTTTTAFTLLASNYYGIAALYKEGGGGDYFELAWRATSDPTPAAQLSPIGPENIYVEASPAGKRATLSQQPQSVTVLEGTSATFDVSADTLPVANQYSVQWMRDLVVIPGAIGSSFTTNNLQSADSGTVIQAKVYTLLGTLLSDPATITIDGDFSPPVPLSAGLFTGETKIGILFDELVETTSAANTGNYTVDGGNLSVLGVELPNIENNLVLLNLDGAPSAGVDVAVSNIKDLFNNTSGTDTLILEASTLAPLTLVNSAGNPVNLGRGAYLGQDNYYVEAGGNDIWGTGDAGFMVNTALAGGFDMQVRVQSLEGPNTWTKGGIMIRESMDTGARNLFLLVTRTAGQNVRTFQWRDTTDAASGDIGGANRLPNVPYPDAWLRLVRTDGTSNLISTFLSTDGTNWTPFFDHTIPGAALPETLIIGMASTSHENGAAAAPARVLFRSFSISSLGVTPVPLTVDTSGGSLELNWDNTASWTLQTTTDLLAGPWIDLPALTPPVNPSATNRVDYYRLKRD